MSEKVLLPKEVADAITRIKEYAGWTNFEIIVALGEETFHESSDLGCLHNYASSPDSRDTLLSALVNGYEIERTPHEELRECYDEFCALSENYRDDYDRGVVYGIKRTLEILGITVEGINDTNTSTDAT